MNIKQLVELHTLSKKPKAHVLLKYCNTTKRWMFAGYSCHQCGTTLKTVYLILKHKCAKYIKIRDRDKEL